MILQAARMPAFDTLPQPRISGPGRVTLVDDDDLVHLALSRNLRRTGWQVTGFTDAEAALAELAARPRPDLLIVDLHMPRMNGDEMLDALGPGWRAGRCRSYLCSAVPPPEHIRRGAAEAGAMLLDKDTLFDRAGLWALLGVAAEARAPALQAVPDPAEPRRSLAGLHP